MVEGSTVADELIGKAVRHVLVAVNCRTWAILEPAAERGLNRAAAFHKHRSDVLLEEFMARVRAGESERAPHVFPRDGGQRGT